LNAYLLINVLVILFPLVLSFDRRVSFFRQWRAVFPAVLIVGAFYIYEDVLATARGNWFFAERWSGDVQWLGLPPGEWFFFITVPYACLFIYACVRSYVPEKIVRFPRFITWLTSGAAALCAWIFRDQGYTMIVMLVFCVTSLALGLLRPDLLGSRQFWAALGLSYCAFLVVNGILTAVPVVLYGPQAIWGIRVITIPLEDFFYNFSLLALNFLLFRIFLDIGALKDSENRRWRTANPLPGELAGPGGLGSVTIPVAAYRFLKTRHGN
jgi:lycopene cyclase domain-containing protein